MAKRRAGSTPGPSLENGGPVAQMYRAARKHMPFSNFHEMPTFVPEFIPIDIAEAKSLYLAFDENLNGDLERDEVLTILRSLGMEEARIDPALNIIFAENAEINWDQFRRWVKRKDFIIRKLPWKERIYLTLEDPTDSKLAMIWAVFIISCIVLSVIMYMLETHPSMNYQPCPGCEPELKSKAAFAAIETCIIIAFTFDYVTRFLTVHGTRTFHGLQFNIIEAFTSFQVLDDASWQDKQYRKIQRGLNSGGANKTFNWLFSPLNVIDFLSVVPYFLEGQIEKSGMPNAMFVLRVLRLCRLFRLFKLQKYSSGFDVFFRTISESMGAISVLLLVLILLIVLFGSLIFLAEGGTWYTPDDICNNGTHSPTCRDAGYPQGAYLRQDRSQQYVEETPFLSVFDASWFTIATITTVGYGDLSPTSDIGKMLAMICMVLGLLAMAMPVTVLGNNFGALSDGNRQDFLMTQLDVFTTLRIGLSKHMELLDRDSKEYDIAKDELQKLECVQVLFKSKYATSVHKEGDSFTHMKQLADKLTNDVAAVNTRLEGMEEKMEKLMDVIKGL
jgi:hypothetical protein